MNAPLHQAADERIEPGAVASTGEDSESQGLGHRKAGRRCQGMGQRL
ncbi:hypothetical protein DB31_5657 [Hyalangium minutum]|uniref:Uncharacterized protein n=1 Tax=Hyalangium minutum TaxID=394096 RepID=A0A085WSF2_9BACT|nr:hypothetical protein DB31_5657 [Hyalangium minutum]